MPTYNSLVDRTGSTSLMPEDASTEIINAAIANSAVLQMARRLPDMSSQIRRLPVISSMPVAYFVDNKGDGGTSFAGLKQTSNAAWSDVYLYAEELAVIVPVPENVVDDSSFDIWGSIRPYLDQAFGAAIDAAILFGTNKPSDWPAALVTGANSAGHTVDLSTVQGAGGDLYDAILGESGVYDFVEQDGYEVTGALAALSLRAKVRAVRDANGQPIFMQDPLSRTGYTVGGVPTAFPKNGGWNAASALMIAGDWDQLVYSVRKDITVKVEDSGVIMDGSGAIIYNLFQQDMVALRAVMRLGFALPNPINPIATNSSTRYPFATLVP